MAAGRTKRAARLSNATEDAEQRAQDRLCARQPFPLLYGWDFQHAVLEIEWRSVAGMDYRYGWGGALSTSSGGGGCECREDQRLRLHGGNGESGGRTAGDDQVQVRGVEGRQYSR